MVNMKGRFCIKLAVVLIFFGGSIYAADINMANILKAPLTDVTEKRFDEICALLSVNSVVKGNFNETKTLLHRDKIESSGKFTISVQDGMIWQTITPRPSIIAVGKEYIVRTTSHRKIRVTGNEAAMFLRISEMLKAVFSGDSAYIKKTFDIYFAETDENWIIALTPKSSTFKKLINKIAIQGKTTINKVLIEETTNDTDNYDLSNYSYAKELTAQEKNYFITDKE
ncbi:MAG: hypothetical protein Ta2F_13660 [Termitinemataceae bacterium]|nr:MAG: hypothetical protein Ta2F_13660 [Termitinemataceae bacterium]